MKQYRFKIAQQSQLLLTTMLLLILLVFTTALNAQVTVGSGKSPVAGSLLDLKEYDLTDPASDNGTTATKGFNLPRVRLVDLDKLLPMFDNMKDTNTYHKDGADYLKAVEDNRHIGLMIYNLTDDPNKGIIEGLYYWDGNKWVTVGKLSVANGISINNGDVELGGTLKRTTTIDLGLNGLHFDSSKGNVRIADTDSPATLDVDGNLRIGSAPVISNSSVLVRDNTTGIVGTAVAVPSKVAFIQSTQNQRLTTQFEKDLFNSGADYQVIWSESDIVSNNIVTFDAVNNYFVIDETGLYELSGFLNYAAYSTVPSSYPTSVDAGRSGVNVTIQVDKNDGNGWIDFTAARYVFTGTAVNNTSVTVIVPPGVSLFSGGTKIRMIFKRPVAFGLEHGTAGNNGITIPVGIQFTKGMKISAL